MEYEQFIDRKTQLGSMDGFAPIWMPDFLFPFQRTSSCSGAGKG